MTNVSLKKNDGFTLIELLVVIIILGVLSGIATLGIRGAIHNSMVKSCELDLASVEVALTGAQNDFGGATSLASRPKLYSGTAPANSRLNANTGLDGTDPYLINGLNNAGGYLHPLDAAKQGSYAITVNVTPGVAGANFSYVIRLWDSVTGPSLNSTLAATNAANKNCSGV